MLVNPSTRWEQGGEGRQRRGAGVSLCVVVEVVWRWCGGGGGVEVVEVVYTHKHSTVAWQGQCCPKDPQLQPARASGLAAYSVPETAETGGAAAAWLSNNMSQAGSSSVV